MVGFGRHMEKEMICPFCNKGKVMVNYREGYVQAKASSISSGKKYTRKVVEDKIENVKNNCPVCGKSAKEIKKAFEKGFTKVLSHKERLKMLKKRGLPLVIGGK